MSYDTYEKSFIYIKGFIEKLFQCETNLKTARLKPISQEPSRPVVNYKPFIRVVKKE